MFLKVLVGIAKLLSKNLCMNLYSSFAQEYLSGLFLRK